MILGRLSRRMLFVLIIFCLTATSLALANPLDSLMSKRIIAFAVYIDNPETKWPGMDTLKDKLVETIISKLNSMIANQIISGAGVLDGLKKYGVENLASADAAALHQYGRENNIAYVVLFALKTTNWAFHMKVYDVDKAVFAYDGQAKSQEVKPPQSESSWGFGEFASSPTQYFMKKIAPALDEQLNQLVKLLKG